MANTFIELNDTPSNYTGSGAKYLQVDGPEGNVIFNNIELNNLADVNAAAPGGGQVLQWSSAANEWRAVTYAPYSEGNGIDFGGTGYVVNVVAGSGGGLTSNSTGVYITDIANVSGTYGNATYTPQITVNSKGQITGVTELQSTITLAESLNASYVGNVIGTSGQITVTGGTGINSNATLNLVATGVTAGIYGNSTAIPRITVDTYGRISSVDVVDAVASGSGNADLSNVTTLAYSNIHVSGQTSLGADRKDDDLTFAGGLAIDATTDANTDTISFALNPTDAAANMSISGFSDVDTDGITNGQVLIWNSSTSKFEAGDMTGGGGSGNSNVSLTDFSVTTATPSGNGSLTYDNAGVFTFTPANVQAGGGSTQSLSWESSNSNLTISSGNSVDLSALSQTLSISGNVITISGSSDTVDLTSALGNVAGNYGDSNVASYLSANGYSNVDSDAQTLSLSANILTISGSNSSVDVGKTRFYYANQSDFPSATTYHGAIAHSHSDGAMYFAHGGSWNKLANDTDLSSYQTTTAATTANTEMQAYVDALETRIIGGANVNLDSLAEVANALANSNTELSTVAFTGTYSDLTSKPTLALSGNTYLTLDGANIDLSSVVGVQGDQGIQGNAGADGVSVSSASLSGDNLQLTLSNATVLTAGNVRGPVGPQGNVGPQGDGNAGVSSATVNGSGNLVITLNDSTTIDAGNVKGADGSQGIQGNAGADGISITNTQLVSDNLVVTYSNTSTSDLGNIRGPVGPTGPAGSDGSDGSDGADGIQLSNLSVTTASASGNGSLAYDNSTGVFTFTPANVSPSYGNTEVQAYLDAQNYSNVDSDAQTLSLSGNVITISGSNSNVDLTTALANVSGGGNYANSNVEAYLSGGTGIDFSTGEISLANTAVTAGTYGSSTQAPVITIDAQGRITSATTQAISGGGGGGGSGTSYEYFKLHYTSGGAIDTAQGTGGISNISSNIGNVTVNNSASNSCEIIVDFGGNYNYPPLAITAYGFSQSTSEYNIKGMIQSAINTTLKLDGSGDPHGSLSTANITMSLTRSETGSSSGFGQSSHAWIYFTMGG